MVRRILNLGSKELIQLRRDWLMLLFIILAPVLELVLMAQSTGQGVTNLPFVVVDQDHSAISRQIVTAIDNTDELHLVAYLDSPDQIADWLDHNRATLAVVLPAGLDADRSIHMPEVQLIADGSNSIPGSYALSAATGAVTTWMARHAESAGRAWASLELHTQVRYNPTLNIRHVTVTVQLGFIVYQVALMVAALGLARERELGTLEQLMVTPLRRFELLSGKAAPAFIIAGLDSVIMWIVIVTSYGVPMRGSFPLLFALALLFIAAEIGWGLTISTLSRTQQQAVLLVFVLALVDISFSGYMVPIERMPPVLQAVSQFFPMQHFLVILRQVMLRGADLSVVMPQVLALLALGFASAVVAMVSLRKRLD